MNLKDIDNIFNDNQHQFDKMPSDKLWERLEEKLDATPSMWEEKPPKKLGVGWLRYVAAAAVILVMMIPAVYMLNNMPHHKGDLAKNSPPSEQMVNHDNNEGASRESLKQIEGDKVVGRTADTTFLYEEEAKTELAEETTSKEEKILAANQANKNKITTNDTKPSNKPNTVSKPPAIRKDKGNQNEETRIVGATSKPSSRDRGLSLGEKTTTSSPREPSISADKDFAAAEEVLEIEEDASGEVLDLDEVKISPYSAPKSVVKAAKVTASFNISDTQGIYAYARYNADFQPNHLSNALPYDGYGYENDRVSQSTGLPKSTQVGRAKKKSKDESNNNIQRKRSASKEDTYPSSTATTSLGFFSSLEGNWSLYSDGFTYQETWKSGNNGTLMGTATTLKNGATFFKEDLNIQLLSGEQMVYTIYHPENSQQLTYQLRTSETSIDNENYLIFDNLQNDFPRSITYRLMNGNDMLKITFEGEKNGAPVTKELILNRL